MGNVSIDISLSNIWKTWYRFKAGKKKSSMIDSFAYNLERNLALLHNELDAGKYVHGKYSTFIVNENKRREISVAHVRDRVVHRVLYEYLVPIFDKTFIYDV